MTRVNWLGTVYTGARGAAAPARRAPRAHRRASPPARGCARSRRAAAYGATKAAQRGYGEALRHELRAHRRVGHHRLPRRDRHGAARPRARPHAALVPGQGRATARRRWPRRSSGPSSTIGASCTTRPRFACSAPSTASPRSSPTGCCTGCAAPVPPRGSTDAWRSRSPPPSCPSSRARARGCPTRPTAGSTSRSGTASARSRSSTATRSTCSRATARPLTRYFPELTFPAGALRARRRDRHRGEDGGEDFNAARPAHPPGRVAGRAMLAERDAGDVHRLRPARPRRRRAARAARGPSAAPRSRRSSSAPVKLDARTSRPPPTPSRGCTTPRASSPSSATRPYKPGERTGMVKIKRVRTIDAVVIGWRPGKAEGTVGSLILALYDAGRASCASSATPAASPRRRSASSSRRSRPTRPASAASATRHAGRSDRELEWVALRPELVVEVTFDHASDGRIRHGTKVQRWRDDKDPARLHDRPARRLT